MNRARLILSIVLVLAFRTVAPAAALDVPFNFSTIETDHFVIHFHQGLKDAALKAAAIAEEAHGSLSREFRQAPAEKTQIVLIDDSDILNSGSSVAPYDAIFIETAPPALDAPINEYDDWLRLVIYREYARILALDRSRGYSKITRKVFGKPAAGADPFTLLASVATAPPNEFLPNWWQDGMAAWAGAEYASGGRGGSAYEEMVLRMAVLEGNLPSIDRIDGEAPWWPGADAPYVFGLEFMRYLAKTYGKDSLERLAAGHSGRFPFFLNGVPEEAFGRDYIALYGDMIKALKKRAFEEMNAIEGSPVTPLRRLPIKGEAVTNPRFSPDGRSLAVNVRDPHGHEAIVVTDPEGLDVRDTIRRLPSDRSISWSPDGGTIYFSQEEIIYGFYAYSDIYSYCLKTGRLKRLTYGRRLREPDISPDGAHFAVIVSDRGSENLAVMEARPRGGKDTLDDNPLAMATGLSLERVANPRWSPDGSAIAYTVTDNNGASSLHVYNVREKTDTKLVEGRFVIGYPAWTKDSSYIVYTSDETKVYNLFAYSFKDKRRFRITNVLGGAFQPDLTAGGRIAFSNYTSGGFDVSSTEFDPGNGVGNAPAPGVLMDADEPGAVNKADAEAKKVEVKGPTPYSPLATIAPRFWLPTISSDNDGVVAGAYTAGQDALAYHSYTLDVDYGAESSRLYYNAAYSYDYFYPTFTIEAHKKPVLYSNFMDKGDYYEERRSYSFQVSVPLNRMESKYTFILGYMWQRQSALSGLDGGGAFNGADVFQGRRGNVFAGMDFSNTLRYPYSISPEEGRTAGLRYRLYSKALGSDVGSQEYVLSYSEYLRPFSEGYRHDVVCLKLKGGISAGRRIGQQAFQLGGDDMESEFPLRGYPARFNAGKYITTATVEYRMPVSYIFGGLNTKPLFAEGVHAALFTDVGEVWGDGSGFSSERLKVGAGAEARVDLTLGYRLKVTPALGVAHGFDQDGETRVYFLIYSSL